VAELDLDFFDAAPSADTGDDPFKQAAAAAKGKPAPATTAQSFDDFFS
jgi:hypothetical protein